MRKLLGREPTLWLQALSALLALGVAFGWGGLSPGRSGLILAFGSALISLQNAIMVRPIAPAVFTGLITSGTALLSGYGLQLPADRVGQVQLAVVAVMALLTRGQVSPVEIPPAASGNSRHGVP